MKQKLTNLVIEAFLWVAFCLILTILFATCAHAINFDAIMQIESDYGLTSHNVAQITPIALKDFNNCTGEQYTMQDMDNPQRSMRVGHWMLFKRLPQLIRAIEQPVTEYSLIVAYNAGISYLKGKKAIPTITKRYIKKYRRLTCKLTD